MPLPPYLRSLANLTKPTREAATRLEDEWAPNLPPDVIAAATLGAAFGSAAANLGTEEIESVGIQVEMLMTTGDKHTGDVIATGFLEALLAQASGGTLHFPSLVRMLGPESLRYCRQWDEFTGVRTNGLW